MADIEEYNSREDSKQRSQIDEDPNITQRNSDSVLGWIKVNTIETLTATLDKAIKIVDCHGFHEDGGPKIKIYTREDENLHEGAFMAQKLIMFYFFAKWAGINKDLPSLTASDKMWRLEMTKDHWCEVYFV